MVEEQKDLANEINKINIDYDNNQTLNLSFSLKLKQALKHLLIFKN